MRPLAAALVLVTCVASAGRAQQRATAADVVTVEHLRAVADSLPPGPSRTAQLGKGEGYTYALTQRDTTGGVERHDEWTDVFVIQSGRATLVSGGAATGAREQKHGEWRGGSIEGGARRALVPGDVVVIPASVFHQMVLAPGDRVAYLAFKLALKR